MAETPLQPVSWERMIGAVEKVRERLHRVTAALDASAIPYAVVGGHAVAAWVSRVDEAAVRNTRDVDLLVSRSDFDRFKQVLQREGFVFCHSKSIDMFLDGPDAKARDAVHLIYAGENISHAQPTPTPSLSESFRDPSFRLINLDALVRMKLNAYRRKDQMHLLDLMDVGLVDRSWLDRVPAVLKERLRELLDDPEG